MSGPETVRVGPLVITRDHPSGPLSVDLRGSRKVVPVTTQGVAGKAAWRAFRLQKVADAYLYELLSKTS